MAYSWMRENASPMSNDPLLFHRSVQVLKSKSRELTESSKANLLKKFKACVNGDKFSYTCKVRLLVRRGRCFVRNRAERILVCMIIVLHPSSVSYRTPSGSADWRCFACGSAFCRSHCFSRLALASRACSRPGATAMAIALLRNKWTRCWTRLRA